MSERRGPDATRSSRRRRLRAPLLAIAALVALDRTFPPDLTRYRDQALLLLDAAGAPLDARVARDGAMRLGAAPADVDPRYLALLLRIEDARFWWHPGVDPLALLRAAGQAAWHGRIVSGGSTISMQVARLLMPHPRTVLGKLTEIARAAQLEARYGKQGILAMYLTLAPMGGDIEGARAGALAWFGHGPETLDAAEAAMLVALPRAPARVRPDRHPRAAVAAAETVLARAGQRAAFDPPTRHDWPHGAYHLAERLRAAGARDPTPTPIDAGLQAAATGVASRELPWLGDRADAAALIVRNVDRAVIAYVGGVTPGPGRAVDIARAIRSPGSTLKPFAYGMAFDEGILTPDTLVEDDPGRFGDYAPRDFDRRARGLVTAREALRHSYNLPAARVLERLGAPRFVAALRRAGAAMALPRDMPPGLPVVLGGVGARLEDLARLYAGLASGGTVRPLRFATSDIGEMTKLLSPAAARDVTDVLRGTPLPEGVAPGARAIAYKTGTSYGFRDAWAAGYSDAYTVVVWVGRADGTPRPGAFGANTAAPLLFRLFDLLPPEPDAAPAPAPRDRPAIALARLRRDPGPRVVFPPAEAVIEARAEDGAMTPVGLRAAGGTPPYRWLADGQPLPPTPPGLRPTWTPEGIGFARLTVVDQAGRAAGVDVRVR